jgi:hypothetical protein
MVKLNPMQPVADIQRWRNEGGLEAASKALSEFGASMREMAVTIGKALAPSLEAIVEVFRTIQVEWMEAQRDPAINYSFLWRTAQPGRKLWHRLFGHDRLMSGIFELSAYCAGCEVFLMEMEI